MTTPPKYDLPSDAMTPAEMLLAGTEARSVRDCLGTLDAGPRQPIMLAFCLGCRIQIWRSTCANRLAG